MCDNQVLWDSQFLRLSRHCLLLMVRYSKVHCRSHERLSTNSSQGDFRLFAYLWIQIFYYFLIYARVSQITTLLGVFRVKFYVHFSSPNLFHATYSKLQNLLFRHYHHQHHHVQEGLGVFPVPWPSKWDWSLHLFLGRPMFLRPFGLYCNAWFGILFVSILCTCCSHFSSYCFIFLTIFCAPVFTPNTVILFY
jgi:hypothetical protein